MKLFDKRTQALIVLSIILVLTILILLCSNLIQKKDLPLAFTSGMITCILTVMIVDLYDNYVLNRKLAHLHGPNWIGYHVEKRSLEKFKIHKDGVEIEYNSSAEITYKGQNILLITLSHDTSEKNIDKRSWKGTIEINRQAPNIGKLTYKYLDSHEVGSREVILHSEEGYDFIYLLPITNKISELKSEDSGKNILIKYDYGFEALKRKINK